MRIFILSVLILALNYSSVYAQDSDKKTIVKVLSFNILHGATTQGDFDLDAIAKVIIEADPDFVALQEVDFKTNRAKKYDLVTELGWRTKMAPIFARAMKYDGGEYGEGVLSKHSFISSRNVPLPHLLTSEPRAALEILTVLPSGDTIAFIGTHLDHLRDETDRISQSKRINEVFSSNKYPTILAGDLNGEPTSKTIQILEEIWTSSYRKTKLEYTFPSNAPTKKIDYVMFLQTSKWKVLKTEVIQDTIASDHCAYLVSLELLKD